MNAFISKVPDLIYQNQALERANEIKPFLKNINKISDFKYLHRVTVFLTYKCNLSCEYCKTIPQSKNELVIRPQKNETYSYTDFVDYLNTLKDYKIKHLHFTGGEASLVKDISKMIKYAKNFGVEFISTTSNGTLNSSKYLELIESGLDEIRVSLDTNELILSKKITGKNESLNKTLETMDFLSKIRTNYPNFFFIINTVINNHNYNNLPNFIEFLLKYNIDDIKLITEVEKKDFIVTLKNKNEIIDKINSFLEKYDKNTFPLLRKKLNTVFEKDCIGLEEISKKNWKCYIPFTERTVDKLYYYPCSVYLRENGEPLGKITDSYQEQINNTVNFVENGNCLEDSICKKYCLNCTKNYNILVNNFSND